MYQEAENRSARNGIKSHPSLLVDWLAGKRWKFSERVMLMGVAIGDWIRGTLLRLAKNVYDCVVYVIGMPAIHHSKPFSDLVWQLFKNTGLFTNRYAIYYVKLTLIIIVTRNLAQ